MRAAVVVVGDLGRSPRMQYHANALAASDAAVDLIGYEGAALPRLIMTHPRITVHRLPEPRLRRRAGASVTLYSLYAIVDVLRSSYQLWRTLLKIPKPDVILVQNPPSMPTLAVAWAIARVRKARLVVDWHNLGYTLLTLRLGQWHPVVRLARWFERIFGRLADAHLCVSRGFARFLHDRFGVAGANVLYDRPASVFVPIERIERERIRQSLFARLGVRGTGRVGFIVSPTSWTAD